MSESRVVVVGTTADYIDHIRQHYPGRALFVTDPEERARAHEDRPDASEEVLCDLSDAGLVMGRLEDHLQAYGMTPDGIACYDCESLGLASSLAEELTLPFPSPAAVASSRNKLSTRTLWHDKGISCPRMRKIRTAAEASSFLQETGSPVVIKPLTGSGSELVFKCRDDRECSLAFATIQKRLTLHENSRMYPTGAPAAPADTRKEFAVEEFIAGTEYSCDVILDGDRLSIIRLTRKIPAPGQSFGTTGAYVLPGVLLEEPAERDLCDLFLRAAHALGLTRAVCMVDFIVRDGTIFLLEMTPRVGGDCLPPLIFGSCGLDMIGLALDFAQGRDPVIPEKSCWRSLVGLRVFAPAAGMVRTIDDCPILGDSRVIRVHIAHGCGSRVIMPPDDYDSRILGYVLFSPRTCTIEQECSELAAKLVIDMEDPSWIRQKMS